MSTTADSLATAEALQGTGREIISAIERPQDTTTMNSFPVGRDRA
jgi:hypothetical protein